MRVKISHVALLVQMLMFLFALFSQLASSACSNHPMRAFSSSAFVLLLVLAVSCSLVLSVAALEDAQPLMATYTGHRDFAPMQDVLFTAIAAAEAAPPARAFHAMTQRRAERSMVTASTTTLASGQFQSVGPLTPPLSLGYWYKPAAGANNIDVFLIPESEYAKFQANAVFSYYTSYSILDTTLAMLSTVALTTAITAPVRFIVSGHSLSATTVNGLYEMFTGSCSRSASSPCSNGGLCNSADNCDCAPNGYSGTTCDTPVCSTITCNSHQSCTAPDTCSCISGWTGATCQTPVCTTACISGQGSCTAPNTCTCVSGWGGASCSMPVCTSTPCNSHQACTGPNSCSCISGWSGASCQTAVCTTPCFAGQGTCIGPNTCTCNSGFSGATCAGVDGGFSAWSNTGSCSASGASCFQQQTRTCSSPAPSNGGATCAGSSTQSISCTCPPIAGGYSAWTGWNLCSSASADKSTCTQSRSRSCNSPTPSNGGADCTVLGSSLDSRVCSACDASGAPTQGGLSSSQINAIASGLGLLAADQCPKTPCPLDCSEVPFTDLWGNPAVWSAIALVAGLCVGITLGVVFLLKWYYRRNERMYHSRSITPLPTTVAVQMHTVAVHQPQPPLHAQAEGQTHTQAWTATQPAHIPA